MVSPDDAHDEHGELARPGDSAARGRDVDPSSVFAPPGASQPPGGPSKFMIVSILTLITGIALVTARLVNERDDSPATAPPPVTTSTDLDVVAPKGFKVLRNDDAGFAIAIPKTWRRFDLVKADMADIRSTLERDAPRLVATLDQVKRVQKIGGVLFAIEPQPGPFSHNLNVIRIEHQLHLDESRDTFARQLKAAGAKKLRFTKAEMPVGEVLVSAYELPQRGPNGKRERVQVRQYYVPARDTTWVVTFSTVDIAKDERVFGRVIASFRVVRV